MNIRPVTSRDYPALLSLNNANLPAVSELQTEGLEHLHSQALHAWIIEDSHALAGFCLILPPSVAYRSDNYTWVSERYDQFEYLDRVVIAEDYRGQGVGRKLYQHWFQCPGQVPLLLEVNIRPMNEGSILFHEKMGFQRVGDQETEGGRKRVQYMARRRPASVDQERKEK